MVNGKTYETLGDAITDVASAGGTIKLAGDASNAGLPVAEGSSFVLDLNKHKLEMVGPGAGSEGTETNALQFLKDSTIIIKNGTLKFNEDPRLKMGIQNYANLILDNVKVIGGPNITYCVSNNYGTVKFQNHTSITAAEGRVAFDAWYGMSSVYDDPGVFVTLDDTVTINGKVEFGKHKRASADKFATNCSITVPSDYELAITPSSAETPMGWHDNGDGTKSFKYQP